MEENTLPKPQTDLPLPEKKLPAHTQKTNIFKSKILIGFVLISTLFAFLIGGIILGNNQKPLVVPPPDEPSYTGSPTPTCRPRPSCLDSIPACKIVETSDMCPKTPTPTQEDNQVFCTQEAKLCPDGSYVGRKGPKCEFEACPTQ